MKPNGTFIAGIVAAGSLGTLMASAPPQALRGHDAEIARSAATMLEQGRKIFRYDTFGSEAFWGDTLQLHRAIAGEKNGGVGTGVSPKTRPSMTRSPPE